MKKPRDNRPPAGSPPDVPPACALLGLCPVLAVTVSTAAGIAISLVFFSVLVLSRLLAELIRRRIGPDLSFFTILAVSSTLAASADILIRTYFPLLHEPLGIYLSLIAVNCIVLLPSGKKTDRPRGPLFTSSMNIAGTVKTGFIYMVTIISMGIVREALGRGTFLGINILGNGYAGSPVLFFILAPGAFLTMAFIFAAIDFVRRRVGRSRDLVLNNPGG